jgi:ABC-type polysaccharide/polyol phosphate export permease
VSEVEQTSGAIVSVPPSWATALGVRARTLWELLLSLTLSDLRARYGRGSWRLAKWLLDPFAATGVYLLLVTFVLNRPGHAPGMSVACAVIPFQLVMLTVNNAISAIRLRRSIILNGSFDRALIPLASVMTETIAFGASLTLLAVLMAAYGIAPTAAIVWFPVVLAMNILLAVSIAYPTALFGLWFPELRIFAVSFVRTLFFLAPGFIALREIHGKANEILRLNPLTGLFEAYRATLLYGQRPAAWQLLIPLAFAVALLGIFVPAFGREQRHFAKVVE